MTFGSAVMSKFSSPVSKRLPHIMNSKSPEYGVYC